jgi:hypothetical protein
MSFQSFGEHGKQRCDLSQGRGVHEAPASGESLPGTGEAGRPGAPRMLARIARKRRARRFGVLGQRGWSEISVVQSGLFRAEDSGSRTLLSLLAVRECVPRATSSLPRGRVAARAATLGSHRAVCSRAHFSQIRPILLVAAAGTFVGRRALNSAASSARARRGGPDSDLGQPPDRLLSGSLSGGPVFAPVAAWSRHKSGAAALIVQPRRRVQARRGKRAAIRAVIRASHRLRLFGSLAAGSALAPPPLVPAEVGHRCETTPLADLLEASVCPLGREPAREPWRIHLS